MYTYLSPRLFHFPVRYYRLSFILSLLDCLWTSLQLVSIIRHNIYTSVYTHACGCCVFSAHIAANAARGGSTTHPTLCPCASTYMYARCVLKRRLVNVSLNKWPRLTDFCITDISWRLFRPSNFRIAAYQQNQYDNMEDRHQFVKYRNRMIYCIIFCIIESSAAADQNSPAPMQRPFYNLLCHLFSTRIQKTQQKMRNRSNWWHVFLTSMYAVSRHRHTWHVIWELKRIDKKSGSTGASSDLAVDWLPVTQLSRMHFVIQRVLEVLCLLYTLQYTDVNDSVTTLFCWQVGYKLRAECVCVCVRARARQYALPVAWYTSIKTAQPKSALKDQFANKVTILLTALTALLPALHREIGDRIKKVSTFFFSKLCRSSYNYAL